MAASTRADEGALVKAAPYGWDGARFRAFVVDGLSELGVVGTPALGGGPPHGESSLVKAVLFAYDPAAGNFRAVECDASGALKVS